MLFRILVFQILSHIDYKIRAHRYCLQDIYIDQLLEWEIIFAESMEQVSYFEENCCVRTGRSLFKPGICGNQSRRSGFLQKRQPRKYCSRGPGGHTQPLHGIPQVVPPSPRPTGPTRHSTRGATCCATSWPAGAWPLGGPCCLSNKRNSGPLSQSGRSGGPGDGRKKPKVPGEWRGEPGRLRACGSLAMPSQPRWPFW